MEQILCFYYFPAIRSSHQPILNNKFFLTYILHSHAVYVDRDGQNEARDSEGLIEPGWYK